MTLHLATDADADSANPVRELSSFCAENIAAFAERDEPVSVALVVLGKQHAGAISWSLNEGKSILEVCSASALLLWDRAIRGA